MGGFKGSYGWAVLKEAMDGQTSFNKILNTFAHISPETDS